MILAMLLTGKSGFDFTAHLISSFMIFYFCHILYISSTRNSFTCPTAISSLSRFNVDRLESVQKLTLNSNKYLVARVTPGD